MDFLDAFGSGLYKADAGGGGSLDDLDDELFPGSPALGFASNSARNVSPSPKRAKYNGTSADTPGPAITIETLADADDDEEDEVFFGAPSLKEIAMAARLNVEAARQKAGKSAGLMASPTPAVAKPVVHPSSLPLPDIVGCKSDLVADVPRVTQSVATAAPNVCVASTSALTTALKTDAGNASTVGTATTTTAPRSPTTDLALVDSKPTKPKSVPGPTPGGRRPGQRPVPGSVRQSGLRRPSKLPTATGTPASRRPPASATTSAQKSTVKKSMSRPPTVPLAKMAAAAANASVSTTPMRRGLVRPQASIRSAAKAAPQSSAQKERRPATNLKTEPKAKATSKLKTPGTSRKPLHETQPTQSTSGEELPPFEKVGTGEDTKAPPPSRCLLVSSPDLEKARNAPVNPYSPIRKRKPLTFEEECCTTTTTRRGPAPMF